MSSSSGQSDKTKRSREETEPVVIFSHGMSASKCVETLKVLLTMLDLQKPADMQIIKDLIYQYLEVSNEQWITEMKNTNETHLKRLKPLKDTSSLKKQIKQSQSLMKMHNLLFNPKTRCCYFLEPEQLRELVIDVLSLLINEEVDECRHSTFELCKAIRIDLITPFIQRVKASSPSWRVASCIAPDGQSIHVVFPQHHRTLVLKPLNGGLTYHVTMQYCRNFSPMGDFLRKLENQLRQDNPKDRTTGFSGKINKIQDSYHCTVIIENRKNKEFISLETIKSVFLNFITIAFSGAPGAVQAQSTTVANVPGSNQPQGAANAPGIGPAQPQRAANASVLGPVQPQGTANASVLGPAQPQRAANAPGIGPIQPQAAVNAHRLGPA